MGVESCFSDLLSHPDKLLEDHLTSVAKRCRDAVERAGVCCSVSSSILSEIAYIAGAAHDVGKATQYFQRYIREKDERRKRKLKSPKTHHSLLSALFALRWVEEYINTLPDDKLPQRYRRLLPVMVFCIVRRHHGDLRNAKDELKCLNEERDVLQSQLSSMDVEKVDCMLRRVGAPVSIGEFREALDSVLAHFRYGGRYQCALRECLHEDDVEPYFIMLLLYSALLDADKSDAMGIDTAERKKLDEGLVDTYKAHALTGKSDMDCMRERIYREVVDAVDSITSRGGIYSISAPTGTGKTLTSFAFALRLRGQIAERGQHVPRIIYILPFLSIIDQNYAVLSEVLRCGLGDEVSQQVLLKHHHMSEVWDESAEEDAARGRFLVERWDSEIIVSTFVQFFHSLFTNRNRSAVKFHNIVGSIVIVDEVQSIPHHYWYLLNRAMHTLAEKFCMHFILVTATQPLIFDWERNEIMELVGDREEYYGALSRVVLNVDLSERSLEEFEQKVHEDLLKRPDKDFLIVLNTIASSKEVYCYLRDVLDASENDLYYLSTDIVPKERLSRILRIRGSMTDKRLVVVSTQLIEAGVDIDFDVVYRDLAPLDCINQVAGRCNRHGGREVGEVNVVVLRDERTNKPFWQYIYSSYLIHRTKEVLSQVSRVDESRLLELSTEYFKQVRELMSDDTSKRCISTIAELRFDDAGRFTLIKEDYPTEDVFVELDDDARRVWEEYSAMVESNGLSGDPFERRAKLRRVKRRLYEYVISVSPKRIRGVGEVHGFRFIPNEEVGQGEGARYDVETGLRDVSGPLIL